MMKFNVGRNKFIAWFYMWTFYHLYTYYQIKYTNSWAVNKYSDGLEIFYFCVTQRLTTY